METLWSFLPIGYCLSVAVETPVLMLCLSPVHPLKRRVFAGFWLTACTYPIFILVLPFLFSSRETYLVVGETFAALAECALFVAAFGWSGRSWATQTRDCGAIVLANLASFGVGEWVNAQGWLDGLAG